MAIEIVTDFRKLMRLAGAVGRAKRSGDMEALAKAEAEHDAYRDLCQRADRMELGCTQSALG